MPRIALAFLALLLSFSTVRWDAATCVAAEFAVEQSDEGVAVKIDGQLFTNYLIKTGPKPILWPVIGPNGAEMTRAYPMKTDVPGEKQDHIHQRSLWFTHGDVNGVDFWSELDGHGSIVHRQYVKVEGGPTATIVAISDWVGPDGRRHLEDERTLVFAANEFGRLLDFSITFKATDGPVTFGDTKEGAMGIRVPTPLDVNSNLGGKVVTSEGGTIAVTGVQTVDGKESPVIHDDAWGKPAPWVDYFGPLGEQVVGVAILNHPSSFRYPTPWHVRNYGLFAANPFGLGDFQGVEEPLGAHTIEAGGSITLRYRFIFHLGDPQQARIAEAFQAYAAEP